MGRSSRQQSVYLEGQARPNEQQLAFTLWSGGGSAADPDSGQQVRVEGGQTYTRQGADPWQKVTSFSDSFAPGGDPMAFLAGAKNVMLQPPAASDRGLTRYTFELDGPWEAFIRLSGTLAVRIGKLIQLDVVLQQAQIGTTGAFSGLVSNLLLQIRTNWKLSLSNIQFDNTRLYVDSGTLITPGGVHCTVQHVQLDGTSPYIHFSGGDICGLSGVEFSVDEGEFGLEVQPIDLLLTANSSRTLTITVTSVHTATDTVNLGLSNPPIGLVYAFSSTLLQPGQSATLTLIDTPLLSDGDYTLNVTGVDVSQTLTSTVTLHVDKPQLDLQAAPNAQTIRPGATAVYTLNLPAPVGLCRCTYRAMI